MDIPEYYWCRGTIRPSYVPPVLVGEALKSWKPPPESLLRALIPGWSNDWTRFRNMHKWVYPVSRWGTSDSCFNLRVDGPDIVFIRHELHILGDIIPVLYNEQDHNKVIFRVGKEAFVYCRDLDGDHCMGAVPLPWGTLLTPEGLKGLLANFSNLDNLTDCDNSDSGAECQSDARRTFLLIMHFLATSEIGPRPIGDPQSWSREDWKDLNSSVMRISVRR